MVGVQESGLYLQIPRGEGKLPLDHADFSAVLEELHLVHKLIDQINSTAVIGIDTFATYRAGNVRHLESGTRIAHYYQHALIFITDHVAFDDLRRVSFGAMYNGVGQCFS